MSRFGVIRQSLGISAFELQENARIHESAAVIFVTILSGGNVYTCAGFNRMPERPTLMTDLAISKNMAPAPGVAPHGQEGVHGTNAQATGQTPGGVTVETGDGERSPRRSSATLNVADKSLSERAIAPISLTPEETKAGIEALKGKTIAPSVATEYMNMVVFDHCGRVVGLRTEQLTKEDLQALNAAVIEDLRFTNSASIRDAGSVESGGDCPPPRIEVELIFSFLNSVEQAAKEKPEHTKLLTAIHCDILSCWLSGDANGRTTGALFRTAAELLQDTFPALSRTARELAAEAAKPKHFTQYHDNIVARHFEAEVVRALVQNPPQSALMAANQFGACLCAFFEAKVDVLSRRKVLMEFAEKLRAVGGPYVDELPHVASFLAKPTWANFNAMMRTNANGFDILKQSWICGVLKDQIDAPWAREGIVFHRQVIVPSRSRTPSVLSTCVTMVPRLLRNLIKGIDAIPKAGRGLATRKLEEIGDKIEALNEDYVLGRTSVQTLLRDIDIAQAARRKAASELKSDVATWLAGQEEAIISAGNSETTEADLDRVRQEATARALQGERELDGRIGLDKLEKELHSELIRGYQFLKNLLENLELCGPDCFRIAQPALGALDAQVNVVWKLREFDGLVELEVDEEVLEDALQQGGRAPQPTQAVGFGGVLPHQPRPDWNEGQSPTWTERSLFPYTHHIDVEAPTRFEVNALSANRYISMGASGSSIAMFNAFRQFQEEGGYNLGDAMLGAIMFMTFDSGHSMSESLGGIAAFQAYLDEPFQDMKLESGKETLEEFVLDYAELKLEKYGASDDTVAVVGDALIAALGRTLEFFDNLH